MSQFSFWQRWLFVLGVVLAIVGMLAALMCIVTPLGPLNSLVDPIFWGKQAAPDPAVNFSRWIYGVMLATFAGWGALVAFIAHYPFKNKEKWAWNCLLVGTLVLYLPDTALSLYFGVIFNAVANTIFLAAVALPLIFTRREFQRQA